MTQNTETYDETDVLRNLFGNYGMRYDQSTGRILATRLHSGGLGGFIFYFNEDTLAELQKPNDKTKPLELIVTDPQLIRLFQQIGPKLKQLTDYEVNVSLMEGAI
jgi:hypothetical protein